MLDKSEPPSDPTLDKYHQSNHGQCLVFLSHRSRERSQSQTARTRQTIMSTALDPLRWPMVLAAEIEVNYQKMGCLRQPLQTLYLAATVTIYLAMMEGLSSLTAVL